MDFEESQAIPLLSAHFLVGRSTPFQEESKETLIINVCIVIGVQQEEANHLKTEFAKGGVYDFW